MADFNGNNDALEVEETCHLGLLLSDGNTEIEIGNANNIRKIHAATTELLKSLGK